MRDLQQTKTHALSMRAEVTWLVSPAAKRTCGCKICAMYHMHNRHAKRALSSMLYITYHVWIPIMVYDACCRKERAGQARCPFCMANNNISGAQNGMVHHLEQAKLRLRSSKIKAHVSINDSRCIFSGSDSIRHRTCTAGLRRERNELIKHLTSDCKHS